MQYKFFLADARDALRLAEDDTMRPAHECTPVYFDSADEAYTHPKASGLTVHSCLAAETIPGVPVGQVKNYG
jgi:hypothetical protein